MLAKDLDRIFGRSKSSILTTNIDGLTWALGEVELNCFRWQKAGRNKPNSPPRLQESQVTVHHEEVDAGENIAVERYANMEQVEEEEDDVQLMSVEEDLKQLAANAGKTRSPQGQTSEQGNLTSQERVTVCGPVQHLESMRGAFSSLELHAIVARKMNLFVVVKEFLCYQREIVGTNPQDDIAEAVCS